jgi:hypothetical protein
LAPEPEDDEDDEGGADGGASGLTREGAYTFVASSILGTKGLAVARSGERVGAESRVSPGGVEGADRVDDGGAFAFTSAPVSASAPASDSAKMRIGDDGQHDAST